jgi:hypothetical protein
MDTTTLYYGVISILLIYVSNNAVNFLQHMSPLDPRRLIALDELAAIPPALVTPGCWACPVDAAFSNGKHMRATAGRARIDGLSGLRSLPLLDRIHNGNLPVSVRWSCWLLIVRHTLSVGVDKRPTAARRVRWLLRTLSRLI